jgi:hypothetical protein
MLLVKMPDCLNATNNCALPIQQDTSSEGAERGVFIVAAPIVPHEGQIGLAASFASKGSLIATIQQTAREFHQIVRATREHQEAGPQRKRTWALAA